MTKTSIRYTPRKNPEFIRELREKVKKYFEENNIPTYGNASIFVKSGLMTILYILPLLAMLSGQISNIWIIFACWILMGIGMAGMGMVLMHDANHGTWSKYKWLNALMGRSLYLFGGSPITWKQQHNIQHHGFTNIEGQDEDIKSVSLLRFSPHQDLKKMHKFQHYYAWFFYGLMTISWISIKDFRQILRYKKENVNLQTKKSYKRLMFDLIVSKILYYAIFLVLPVIFVPVAWYWTLLFFFIMHFISGFLLTIIFQSAHVMPDSDFPLPDEKGTIDNNWAIHQLSTTSNFSPKNRVFSWLIGGLNYQVEHHLFPNISHVHYRKISTLVKNTAQKYGLPYHIQPNFFKAVSEHGRMLRILGSKEKLAD
ncbi:MAG: acyl-CoA desaturase [Bacteroidota bacterium]|nr:acyl-CoA desaturase [Bacteroidota bacterium]